MLFLMGKTLVGEHLLFGPLAMGLAGHSLNE